MTGLRIAELAERSGFSASTLRYYEQLGLLEPPVRAPNGYRIYDEEAVERLAFVDHAKRMGFALDEISELVRLWTAGECPPVQHRIRVLLDERRRDVRGQVAELSAFGDQLDQVADRLNSMTAPERCGPDCGCGETVPGTRARALPMPIRRAEPVAIACSLEADAMPERLAEWRAVGARARAITQTAAGVYARFSFDAELTATVAQLVALEVSCCPFFTMKLDVSNDALELWIDAPGGAADLARELINPSQ